MIRFDDPEWLLLLLAVPLVIYRYVARQRKGRAGIRFSDLTVLQRAVPSPRVRLRHLAIGLRSVAAVLLILALARPLSGREGREILTQGIDIVLAIDVSSSMEAKDLDHQRKTRLQVCKEVVSQFVQGRTNDRLGLVVFAAESYTQCPLTLDYDVFLRLLDEIKIAGDDWDGTAIGTGIATAANRLLKSDAKSRVIVLLTDGVNNRGEVDPLTAARAAKAVDIRIYTIGAGSEGTILKQVDGGLFGPRQVPVKVEIDEQTLAEVARITGGRYFRATSERKLEEIYREIGEMERQDIKTRDYVDYTDLFPRLLWPGFGLLGLEALLASTLLRRVP